MAEHIINISQWTKKGSIRQDNIANISEALENYADHRVELAMQGRYLSPEDKREWLRENEWSGL